MLDVGIELLNRSIWSICPELRSKGIDFLMSNEGVWLFAYNVFLVCDAIEVSGLEKFHPDSWTTKYYRSEFSMRDMDT